jgi:hypothetical protein
MSRGRPRQRSLIPDFYTCAGLWINYGINYYLGRGKIVKIHQKIINLFCKLTFTLTNQKIIRANRPVIGADPLEISAEKRTVPRHYTQTKLENSPLNIERAANNKWGLLNSALFVQSIFQAIPLINFQFITSRI